VRCAGLGSIAGALALFCAPVWAQAQNPSHDKWQKIEADNGAEYAIDLDSIQRGGGQAEAAVCILDNGACNIQNLRRLTFDCHGHFMDWDSHQTEIAPPRSIVGRFSAIACAGVTDKQPEQAEAKSDSAPSTNSPAAVYQSRFLLAGFLVRAGYVCESDAKMNVDAGLGLLGTSELKTMSKSYPKTTAQWMEEGAQNFNKAVMSSGVQGACAYAVQVRHRAEKIAQDN
jgi:hypothetical protein